MRLTRSEAVVLVPPGIVLLFGFIVRARPTVCSGIGTGGEFDRFGQPCEGQGRSVDGEWNLVGCVATLSNNVASRPRRCDCVALNFHSRRGDDGSIVYTCFAGLYYDDRGCIDFPVAFADAEHADSCIVFSFFPRQSCEIANLVA